MSENENNIIPINRASIQALTKALEFIKNQRWEGPDKFNTIFVDNKNFIKQDLLPNPPPPYWDIAIIPKIRFTGLVRPENMISPIERVRFFFYRKIGDTLEYRQE